MESQSRHRSGQPPPRAPQDKLGRNQCTIHCHAHMTSGQVKLFTLHSIQLLGRFIKDKSTAVWRCWCLHVHYVAALLQHSFTAVSVLAIDNLIMQQQELFLQIPQYEELWKPKNHYVQHMPLEILRFGPPRGYWCMRFEAMHQFFKKAAKNSNFKDAAKSVGLAYINRKSYEMKWEHHGGQSTEVCGEY
jgi:hypothetical protein